MLHLEQHTFIHISVKSADMGLSHTITFGLTDIKITCKFDHIIVLLLLSVVFVCMNSRIILFHNLEVFNNHNWSNYHKGFFRNII